MEFIKGLFQRITSDLFSFRYGCLTTLGILALCAIIFAWIETTFGNTTLFYVVSSPIAVITWVFLIYGFALGIRYFLYRTGIIPPNLKPTGVGGNTALDQSPEVSDKGLYLGIFLKTKGIFFKKKEVCTYRYNNKPHLITFARTRSGKGTTSIIPNLLEYPGPIFIIDPKGENALNTALFREKELGHIVNILDPFNESGIGNAFYNPMAEIDTNNAETECLQLAKALIRSEPGNAAFWSEMGSSLLAAGIYNVHRSTRYTEDEKNLITVYDRLLAEREEFVMEMEDDLTSPIIKHAVAEIKNADKDVTSSVYSTIRSNLTFMNDPNIRRSMERNTFSMKDQLDGKSDVYMVLPLDKLRAFSNWQRVIMTSTIQKLIRTQPDGRFPTERIVFFLDEFGNLGHLEILENAFTTAAGYGVQLWPFVQSIGQLKKHYPNSWETIMGQAGVTEVFGIGDFETAKHFSDTLGKTSYMVPHYNYDKDGKLTRGLSETTQNFMNPEDIMRMDDYVKLILRQGKQPSMICKMAYYEEPEFERRWKRNIELTVERKPETARYFESLGK